MTEAADPASAGPLAEPGAPSSTRRLLARLRDIMAGSDGLQARLDKIVRVVSAEMLADVCSCYVLRPGDVLELYATVGLNPAAVHRTRLRMGQGLVGQIGDSGRPLAIANAPEHPGFVYRPETGEDPYQSLMGVPILRGGVVRGVLVIQHRQRRDHSEDEVETLQTVAMVVAETIAGSHRPPVRPGDVETEQPGSLLPARLVGRSVHGGVAIGTAVLHRPVLADRQVLADDPSHEIDRLYAAMDAMQDGLERLLDDPALSANPESRDILETYRMFARDRGWQKRLGEAVRSGLTAESAVERVRLDMHARLENAADRYLRERLHDFDDLTVRLKMHLAGHETVTGGTLPENAVLIGRTIGPAELLDYDQSRLRGVVLEDGSATSHVAILSRALGIPMIGACSHAMARIEPFDTVIVDADNAQVIVRPADDVVETFAETLRRRAERRRARVADARLPAVTGDGTAVSLDINAGLLADLPQLHAVGADGIGLYRTEIPFMVRSSFPDAEEQTRTYRAVLDRADGRPVVFRTLDIGGDKVLPYFRGLPADNPALGWRAIRIGLDRPALLRLQIRALIQAADGRPLSLMFPLVTEVAEFEAGRRLIDGELARAARNGGPLPARLSVGVMLEVPALLWQLPALLRRVDFVSVGSNDLLQYIFACDRGSPRLSQRYDALSPPVLKLLKQVVEDAGAAEVPVSLCGELAGEPLAAMALVGLGFRRLSMTAEAVGEVRATIRSMRLSAVADYVESLIDLPHHSVRDRLRAFAVDHGIPV